MGIAARLLSLSPRTFFLIDGMGALLTAGLLLGVLANFEDDFGVPTGPLYWLAGIAAIFAVYDLGCAVFLKENWRPFLRAIALANLGYCGLTIALIYFILPSVTTLGQAYFAGESMVVGLLVWMEWRKAMIR